MPNISATDQLSSGDQFVVTKSQSGDFRTLTQAAMLDFIQAQFSSPDVATTLYVPSTGFNIAIGTPTSNIWALLQPAGTLATGTVTLPLNTVTPSGTEVLITSTQIITTFTLAANGASATYGAPTTMAANAFFRMRFYQDTNSWYRIG